MAPKLLIKDLLTEFFIKSLPSLLVSFLLFGGGIVLLALRIPGWSLFLGLPSVQIGIVFLIYTFESVGRRRSVLPTEEYHFVSCLVCGQQTQAPKYIQKRICDDCQVKIAQKVKLAAITIYLLITVPLTLSLMGEPRDLKEKATGSISCVESNWVPTECRCGAWEKGFCPHGELKRTCEGKKYCCSWQNQTWTCFPLND